MSNEEDKDEYLFKVLVVGEIGTGKTSIIKRYVHNIFSDHYKSTIGVDFALKVIDREDSISRLQLWDIAGQERFGNMTRVYYKEADGAIIVFDITRNPTFEHVARWLNDIRCKVNLPDGRAIPVVLFANKADLQLDIDFSSVNKDQHLINLTGFCDNHGIQAWELTSARTGLGISDGVNKLLDCMLEHKDIKHNRMKEVENAVDVSCEESRFSRLNCCV